MADDIQRVGTRIQPAYGIQYRQPDIMARHHDQHHLDKHRQLPCDRTLPGQLAEGQRDEQRQQRDDHTGHHAQDHALELIQQAGKGSWHASMRQ